MLVPRPGDTKWQPIVTPELVLRGSQNHIMCVLVRYLADFFQNLAFGIHE